MGSYEFQALFGAINYISMYPTLIAIPSLWALLLFNIDMVHFTEENMKSMQGVFFLLMVVVSPSYIVALYYKYTNFTAVTIFQRVTVVATCALVTGLIGQDPFDNRNFVSLMFIVDVGGGIAHGFSHPNGLHGVFKNIWSLSKNPPTNNFNKALRVEAYVGMTFGFMATVYAAVVAQVKLGIIISMLATIIPFFWFGFHANDLSETPTKCLLVHRLIITGSLRYLSEVLDFGKLNIVFYLMSGAMVVGVISPYLSAIATGVSTLFLYKLGSDYVLSVEGAAFYWMLGWGIVTSITSYGWLFLFYDEYSDKQKKRVMDTNWQDYILGLFCFVSGAALDKAGFLLPGTVGAPVVYLLPPVTLWFTLESKRLIHIQVGTPFHPTWWMDGDLPQFSPAGVNANFGIVSALITVVLTTYACYAVNSAVGFDSLSFATETTWKYALAHGSLFIWHSGMWMLVASSGIPPTAHRTKPTSTFPPGLPAFVQANPRDCNPVHKADLFIGVGLLFAGTFLIDDAKHAMPLKVIVGLTWAFQIVMKLKVHNKGWGHVAPVIKKD